MNVLLLWLLIRRLRSYEPDIVDEIQKYVMLGMRANVLRRFPQCQINLKRIATMRRVSTDPRVLTVINHVETNIHQGIQKVMDYQLRTGTPWQQYCSTPSIEGAGDMLFRGLYQQVMRRFREKHANNQPKIHRILDHFFIPGTNKLK